MFPRDGGANALTAAVIPLDNIEQVFGWMQFAGHDLKAMQIKDLRNTVPLRDLLLVLGAELEDNNTTPALRLAPGLPHRL